MVYIRIQCAWRYVSGHCIKMYVYMYDEYTHVATYVYVYMV